MIRTMAKTNASDHAPETSHAPARSASSKPEANPCRKPGTLVPVVCRAAPMDLTSDPALLSDGAKVTVRRLSRGINYVTRDELFRHGEVVRVMVAGEPLPSGEVEDLSYDEWRAFPSCPCAMSGRTEIMDPTAQVSRDAIQLARGSVNLPSLRIWADLENAEQESRQPVRHAISVQIKRLEQRARKAKSTN